MTDEKGTHWLRKRKHSDKWQRRQRGKEYVDRRGWNALTVRKGIEKKRRKTTDESAQTDGK